MPPSTDPARRSRLSPDDGTFAVWADLHNHTLLSDGVGEPEDAFASMRDSGLDVAALTDHATIGYGLFSRIDPCARFTRPSPQHGGCRAAVGLNDDGWHRTGALADAADEPGRFTAIRGFEWTHPLLGHLNVWDSANWIDALHTVGIGWDGLGDEARRIPGIGTLLHDVLSAIPGDPGMGPLYDWLTQEPHGEHGGGHDALAGFNHPGREPGWFDAFRHDPRLAERMVSVEAFNKTDDFLFDDPTQSALTACLDAGWRPGLIGVSDEHGADWGRPVGKGRAVLWVRELTRAGVREALLARRVAATRERGLRIDATAGGVHTAAVGRGVRMGGTVPHRRGPLTFALDLGPGREWAGRRVQVQLLRPGGELPAVAHLEDGTVPDTGAPPITVTVDLDADDGPWVLLRIADPDTPSHDPAPPGHPGALRALAYTSPFWLDPTGVTGS